MSSLKGSWQSTSCSQKFPVQVIPTGVASAILLHKNTIEVTTVNIVGKVKALSEIFRVKKDEVFIIQLEDNVNILVKVEITCYHKNVHPNKSFVFHDLKPTTLKKGAKKDVKLYVPAKGFCVQNVQDCIHKEVDLEEILQSFCQDDVERQRLLHDYALTVSSSSLHPSQILTSSYQGVITNSSFGFLGFFELDKKVWLCLSCVPARNRHDFLGTGCKVYVHNAHMHCGKQAKLCLTGCMLTCVKEENDASSPKNSKTVHMPQLLQEIWWKNGMSRSEIASLCNFFSCLLSVGGKCDKSTTKRQVAEFLKERYSSFNSKEKPIRNFLQEFLENNHSSCFFETNKDTNDGVIPIINSIPKQNSLNFDVKHQTNELSSVEPYEWTWSYGTEQFQCEQNQCLIGVLDLSNDGSIVLKNGENIIRCIITKCCQMNSNTEVTFLGACSCGQRRVTAGNPFPCPFVHTYNIGCVVMVTAYSVVKEVIGGQDSCTEDGVSLLDGPCCFVYLVFSLQNCLLIFDPKYETTNRKSQDVFDQHGDAVHQNPVMAETNVDDVTPNENKRPRTHQALSSASLSSLSLSSSSSSAADCKTTLFIQRKETILQESLAGGTYRYRYCAIGNIVPKSHDVCRETFCQKEDIVILFNDDNVRWFPVLHEDALYILDGMKTMDSFHLSSIPWEKRRAALKSGGKYCVILPKEAMLQQISVLPAGERLMRSIESLSITDESSEIRQEELNTVVVIILSRKFVSRESLCHSASKQTGSKKCPNLKLHVQCTHSDAETDIYLSLDLIPYPLGLLPNTVIRFDRLERRVSRKGVFYLQYLAISNFSILALSSAVESNTIASHNSPDMVVPSVNRNSSLKTTASVYHDTKRNAQLMFLADVWRKKVHSKTTFVCIGHIERVLKISLKHVCVRCSSNVARSLCTNSSCGLENQTRFVARASCIVEDGTSSAYVTFKGTPVKNVLDLDAQEWSALQDAVLVEGEVFLQKECPFDGTTLERFVFGLCDDEEIKGDKEFYLKLVTSPQCCLDELKIEDFPIKKVDLLKEPFESHSLPLLQLECEDVKLIDYNKRTLQVLQHVSEFYDFG